MGQMVDASFTWSPDGQYICYAASEPGSDGVSRLHVVDVETCESLPIEFDRTKLKIELQTDDHHLLNKNWLSRLIPDIFERRMIPRLVHGSEHQPDWRV